MISLSSIDYKISESTLFDDVSYFSVPVPDRVKGEKIVLLYAGEAPEEEIKERLGKVKLPPLMQPAAVMKVDELPRLGSGKVDFVTAKRIAQERLGS